MNVNQYVSQYVSSVSHKHLAATISLLEGGGTVPFVARYRKEQTGSMDEVQVQEVSKRSVEYNDLIKRKEYILNALAEDAKLSDNLKKKIESCWSPQALEEIYAPFKKSRLTKADKATKAGLLPLAKTIMAQRQSDIRHLAKRYVCDSYATVDKCIDGACHIIAQWVNEHDSSRSYVTDIMTKHGRLKSKVKRGRKEDAAKYRDYFDFEERVSKIPSHRYLAISRGESEGLLSASVTIDDERAIDFIGRRFVKQGSACRDVVMTAVKDGYKRLLRPSVESAIRSRLQIKSDEEAIKVFASNARQLLMEAPYGEKVTIGIDPGYRTGCKVACVDQHGDLLANDTIYPHTSLHKKQEAESILQKMVSKYNVQGIAIGNGTASRETRSFVEMLGLPAEVFVISESGASIYSASEIAREEFGDLDLTVRGAISLARRLMDPLAELVKIDPKSIGVGQYQHDVDQTKLREALTHTVVSCVNQVGVNLNTASKHLLTYISGLGPGLAGKIVDHRTKIGGFESRSQLKDVPRLGAKAFEQSAGFLRIVDGTNPLDETAVHPESYSVVKRIAKREGVEVQSLIESKELRSSVDLQQYVNEKYGIVSLASILDDLGKGTSDVRGVAETFSFDRSVSKIEDLQIGQKLPGVVSNITKFGAFVDVGVKQDGLVHISQVSSEFVDDISKVLHLGQQVYATVLEVDLTRKRISLSLI